MRQVLWNLVRNAIQASSAGVHRHRPGRPSDDRHVTLAVDDQGPGVPEDIGPRIFDEYFTTRTHGAGIGLAVVRRILDDHAAMGGRLEVARAEVAASFQVTLSREVAGLKRSLRPPSQVA